MYATHENEFVCTFVPDDLIVSNEFVGFVWVGLHMYSDGAARPGHYQT